MRELSMDESMREFESQLSHLRPQPLSEELAARIATRLDEPARRNVADRCLITFMGAGALAASVIVCLLSWQAIADTSPDSSRPLAVVARHPPASIGEYQQALARSNDSTLELFR